MPYRKILTPDVRPDLYDDYDGQLYSPHSLNDLLTTTPKHVKRLIEQRQGKSFIDVAKERVADSWRRALIRYEVDGEVFRLVPGRELEKFNHETGEFNPYEGEDTVTLKMPMNIDDARLFMRAEPKLEDDQR